MKFAKLTSYLEKLESTQSRLEITEILSELFKESKPNEIDKIIYLLLGGLAPKFESIVFNLSEKLMLQAVAQGFNRELGEVRKIYKKTGDIGTAASQLSNKNSSDLTVIEVYNELFKIARLEGQGSVDKKTSNMAKLLLRLDAKSSKFVARITIGKLRLGFSDKTMIDALSWMQTGDKTHSKVIEQAYFVLPDIGTLAANIKRVGVEKATKNISPQTGAPILPMLAQRLKSPADMIEKMSKVAIEPKLDGLRIQLHFKKGTTQKAFTRNLNETSWMFPELEKIAQQLKVNEIILDTEAVGLDENTKKLANFQSTMTRRRKHNIESVSSKIGITFYVFDILKLNNTNLMGESYINRRKVLQKTIKPSKLVKIVESKESTSATEIAQANTERHKEGYEGIIVKKLDSTYVPGRTGWRWVKMKEAESATAKLVDTVDCVVMGYTQGKGKRAQFGIGQFLVGIADGEKIKTITKVGTGLTDDQFKDLASRLKKLETKNKPKNYELDKDLTPDFWVTQDQIVEIAADELTKSPKHSSGYALRFPRLVKFRDDKSHPTAIKEIKHLYKIQ